MFKWWKKKTPPGEVDIGIEEADGWEDHSAPVHAPHALDFEIAHRRTVYVLHKSVAGNFVMFGVISVLATLLYASWPLKEIKLGLLRGTCEGERTLWVEPLHKDVDGVKLFLEQQVGLWLDDVETIDGMTEAERFSRARWMATTTVWNDFETRRIKSGAVQKAISTGLSRQVVVHVVHEIDSLETGVRKLRAEYTLIDRERGKELERKRVEAIVAIVFLGKEIRLEDRYMNPLGATVIAWTKTPKKLEG